MIKAHNRPFDLYTIFVRSNGQGPFVGKVETYERRDHVRKSSLNFQSKTATLTHPR
jgi:hypothetical protein